MANPATLVSEAPPRPAPAASTGGEGAPIPIINPFPRAADKVFKPFDDRTLTLVAPAGSSAQRQGPVSVVPMGYARAIVLLVEATGGTGVAAVAHGDAPWNALQSISIEDTAGRPIVGPLSGYQLFQANKRGGYLGFNNPDAYPSFQAVQTNGNFAFKVRIPLEITPRDALGALPNQTSASTFKVFYSLSPAADIYTTAPTTAPTSVRVRCFLEAWSQPRDFAPDGTQNAMRPPAAGTVQFWTASNVNVSPGEQRITLQRVGNHLRNLGLIYYNDNVPRIRESAEFPDFIRLEMDNKILFEIPKSVWVDQMFERYGFAADTGVFWLDFIHDMDGRAGHEGRNLWLPTTSGTRLDVIGNFTGTGGVLQILTNDVLVRDAEIAAGV
jgi:hypothetical protein